MWGNSFVEKCVINSESELYLLKRYILCYPDMTLEVLLCVKYQVFVSLSCLSKHFHWFIQEGQEKSWGVQHCERKGVWNSWVQFACRHARSQKTMSSSIECMKKNLKQGGQSYKRFAKSRSRSHEKWPTVVASLMLIACLVVESIQRWFLYLCWPSIKVKVIKTSMSTLWHP